MTKTTLNPSAVREIREKAAITLEAGRALINRSYLSDMGRYPVHAFAQQGAVFNPASDMRIFRIERIVQENKQSVLESTTAAYTALGAAGYSVFLYLRCDGIETHLYIGTRGEPGKMLGHNSGELLRETFKGHFSGSALCPLKAQDVDALLNGLKAEKANPSASITAVTGVPALSTDNREHFMQGLERFIDAAESRKYQALILAEPVSAQNLDLIRAGYEQVATQLWPLLKQQLAFGEQESDSVGLSFSQGLSESLGQSLGLTETKGTSHTTGTSTTETQGTSESEVAQSTTAKMAGLFDKSLGALLSEQRTTGTSQSTSQGTSDSHATSWSESSARTTSSTNGTSTTDTQSLNRTLGANRQISIETVDKTIEQLLGKIDHHLERIDEAKTYGGWNSAAYFIGDSSASSVSLASIFLGLTRGSKSSHEDFALTTWNSSPKSAVLDWLTTFTHPRLKPDFSSSVPISYLTPATLISGKEMAIQLSLPRRSTSTVAVVETQAFGRKVQRLDGTSHAQGEARTLTLGHIRHLWENLPQSISLSLDQLSSHVFVSGSTGAGKSNTLYEMLNQISAAKIPFLVIEPAKGEYKHVFGQRSDVHVLGTHAGHSELLRINPFCFPDAIHVLEHVDRLVEIFNVCWPMYAAMPAVLKDAILQAYETCGWDLDTSTNNINDQLFPTFTDVLATLETVIEASAYSQELKGNYIGSLATRIKSLTNGINGQIFSANEIDSRVLFDSNVIVDLSRVGSAETKSLIMGILIMRLSEYRLATGGMNQPLRHVTVLEEAHNILKRSTGEGSAQGSSVGAKSVEMLTNAIAEMRTYGEGFIIVDQSPHAVDIAAIRNTNTKIIMRLPDEMDRRLIGKSVALRDDQLDEIAKLPKGVAIVYQNDWLEPVLCQIKKFSGSEQPYVFQPKAQSRSDTKRFNLNVLKLLLARRIRQRVEVDLALLENTLLHSPLLARSKIALFSAIKQQRNGQPLTLDKPEAFASCAQIIVDVLGCRRAVQQIIEHASDYQDLSDQLNSLLMACTTDLCAELALAAQQCLMKDYSLQHPSHLQIYAAWHKHLETGCVA
ncbi:MULTISPECIES: ATP-binding protein [Pseudomonas]|uniref:ATP-binding protein n=1 Tax=Pseudomonas psychrophila TaxID=122355 RepID=A0A8I1FVU4_9PSED|nr:MULTISPECIES: ATP-binding protein [Pseudomonas]MBJ2258080.1 ATP-binding protein [Pseudomonas psychrophila]MDY7580973.1 ATP-binding protein [Pseudomonas sp. CCI3.1]MEB0069621.1 ATP-binding protein [Pseudomonas sp. CCI3.1]MEB0071108.1 ATP-binding protein [Pseudomonas sp. CCI1.4]